MSELLTLKGTNGVSEIHIESGLLARAAFCASNTVLVRRNNFRNVLDSILLLKKYI